MINFGKRVKELRQAQKITKEEFCGDEAELSIRQLTRIESGVSTPTLAKVEFIASRLGVQIGDLTDQKKLQLPSRYKDIKFTLLHTQTYMNQEKINLRRQYFDEIYNDFFDDLPEEEQLIVEILDSHLEIFVDRKSYTATKILKEYLEQVFKKITYELNDLIFLNLYFHYVQTSQSDKELYHEQTHNQIIENLLNQSATTPSDLLFMLNRVLIVAFGTTETLKQHLYADKIIVAVESNMERAQDLEKTAILNLMKWKYELYHQGDLDAAKQYFQKAQLFADLTHDEHLSQRLNHEWQDDLILLSLD